jgi:hypothetical protein
MGSSEKRVGEAVLEMVLATKVLMAMISGIWELILLAKAVAE